MTRESVAALVREVIEGFDVRQVIIDVEFDGPLGGLDRIEPFPSEVLELLATYPADLNDLRCVIELTIAHSIFPGAPISRSLVEEMITVWEHHRVVSRPTRSVH